MKKKMTIPSNVAYGWTSSFSYQKANVYNFREHRTVRHSVTEMIMAERKGIVLLIIVLFRHVC